MLVGRTGELTELGHALRAGLCSVVVVGEAGVGKTTLIREAIAASGRTAFEGGALATLSWSAYLPLRRALGEASGPDWGGDAEYAAARVEDRLGDGILVLDDLQWADSATMAVVPLLADRVPIIAAVRRGDPGADAALASLAEAGFTTLGLEPLDDAAAVQLARALKTELDDREAESLVRRAGGNPLLIEELAASGTTATLGVAVRARTRDLSSEAVHGLELLALAGRALAASTIPGGEELRRAGLVLDDGVELGIRHALLAETIAADLTPERAQEVHRELAAILPHPGDRSTHLLAAGDLTDGYAEAMIAVEAATTPGERSAHLVTAALCSSASAEPDLLLRAAQSAVDALDFAQADEILARLPPDDVLQARAAIIRARARSEAGDYEGWDAVVADGLERASGRDLDVEVALLAQRAKIILFREQDAAAAAEVAARAVEQAERRRAYRGHAYYILGTIQYFAGSLEWQLSLPRALEFARMENDLAIEFSIANNIIVAHEGAGDPGVGAAFAEEMIARADEFKLLRWRRHFWSTRLNLAMHAGDYGLVAEQAPQLLAGPVIRRTREEVSSAWALSLVELGRIDEGLEVGEEALADSTLHRSNLHHLRAIAYEFAGRPAAALEEYEPFLLSSENPHRRGLAAPVFQWAAYHAGQPPVEIPDLTEAFELAMLRGVPHELAGIDALRDGSPADAAVEFAAAARLWARHSRQGEVRCRWAEGVALADAGQAGEAIERLVEAEKVAARHGMEPMLARIRKSLRALGVARSAPRRRRRGEDLTERERQVLFLVARGLSDATIGVRLGVSARTVESQILSARRKLGASNRRQAAAMATGTAPEAS